MTTSKKQIPRRTNRVYSVFWIACIGFIFIQALRITLPVAFASDSWLHMGIGRYILEQKSIPSHIDISVKIAEPALEWVSHSWLSDLMIYLGTGANSSLGALLLLSGMLFITLVAIYSISRHLALPNTVTWILLSITSISSILFWKIHPFLFLPPLMLSYIYTYIRWRKTQRMSFLLTMIGCTLLWTNLAGGFVFIPILFMLLCALTDIIDVTWISKQTSHIQKHTLRLWLGTLIASALMTIISPNGIRIPIYNVTIIGLLNARKWYSTLGGALEAANSSVIKLAPSSPIFVFILIYIIATLIALSYIFVTHDPKMQKKLLPVVPTIMFLFLPFIWIRFIPLGVIATIPLFGSILVILHDRFGITFPFLRAYIRTIAAACILLLTNWLFWFPPTLISFAPPKDQMDFISAQKIPHPLLISTDLVGYTYWRTYPKKGFIDAQDELFDEHDAIALFSAYAPINESDITTLMETYTFPSVMVTKENDYLTGYFSTLPTWTLVYMDYNGVLFVRNDAVPDGFIREYGLNAVNFSLDLGATPESISTAIRQLVQFTERYPASTLALGQLATMYRHNNQLDRAAATLQRIPKAQWNYVVKTEMGRITAAQGLCKQAESWFLEALRERNEQNVSKTTFDLAVLYAVCLNDIPKAKHFFKRYTSYPIPNQERERVTQLMKKFISDIDTVK